MNKEIDLAELQAELEQKYGPAVAQGIIDDLMPRRSPRLAQSVKAAPDYMDVKAMSEMQEQARAQAFLAVWKLKEWRGTQSGTASKNLIVMQGALLRRDCEEAIALYRLTTKRYFSMYREAMAAFTRPAYVSPFARSVA